MIGRASKASKTTRPSDTGRVRPGDGPIVKRQWPQFYTGDDKAAEKA